MNIAEFSALDLEDRSEILWDLGKIVGELNAEGPIVVLFSLYDFIVEMHFTPDGSQVSNILAGLSSSTF